MITIVKEKGLFFAWFASAFLSSGTALAAGDTVDITVTLDTIWVLIAAFLVFIMHAGLLTRLYHLKYR